MAVPPPQPAEPAHPSRFTGIRIESAALPTRRFDRTAPTEEMKMMTPKFLRARTLFAGAALAVAATLPPTATSKCSSLPLLPRCLLLLPCCHAATAATALSPPP